MIKKSTYLILKRLLDISVSVFGIIVLLLPLITIGILIKLTSKGPIIHWSKRIGNNNSYFMMAKFRTMFVDTPQSPYHLLPNPENFITGFGRILRKFSIDELPQLLNILRGEMTLVGPRPALFNYKELISQRTDRNIHTLVPGLTGWAQINFDINFPVQSTVEYDTYYLKYCSLSFDIKIIFKTFIYLLSSQTRFFKNNESNEINNSILSLTKSETDYSI